MKTTSSRAANATYLRIKKLAGKSGFNSLPLGQKLHASKLEMIIDTEFEEALSMRAIIDSLTGVAQEELYAKMTKLKPMSESAFKDSYQFRYGREGSKLVVAVMNILLDEEIQKREQNLNIKMTSKIQEALASGAEGGMVRIEEDEHPMHNPPLYTAHVDMVEVVSEPFDMFCRCRIPDYLIDLKDCIVGFLKIPDNVKISYVQSVDRSNAYSNFMVFIPHGPYAFKIGVFK